MTEERRVRFVIMKLVGQAQVWWTGVENEMRDVGQPPIVYWEEMKLRLKQKYLAYDYQNKLFDHLIALRQWSMTVMEYMNKFEELKIKCQGVEDPQQTLLI